jgi:hypothetical protein
VVPDNLKSGVSRVCRYEPDINPTYHALANHYQTVIIPALVRKPRDKREYGAREYGDSIPNSFPVSLAPVSAALKSAQEFFPDFQRNLSSLKGDQFVHDGESYPLLHGKRAVKIRPSQESTEAMARP